MAHHSFNFNTKQSKMDKAKKMYDRERHRISSTNGYPNYKNKDRIYKIKYVKDIIQDLEQYGPAGLIHIAILSNIIQRPIKIWNANGNLNKIIGKRKMRHPVNIEYHMSDSKGVGHWTLRGGKDPDNVIIDLNSCLFSVIGSQIGQDPLRLRKWTMLKLKNNFQNLAKWIDKILQSEGNLMIGGACYRGTWYGDAGKILDKSQNQEPYENCGAKGHPRGHASHPSCVSRIEEYSINTWKTGFLSRADQDYVTHLALKTPIAKRAMKRLNRGELIEVIHIPAAELKQKCCDLPKVKEWQNGREKASSEVDITKVKFVLTHHKDKFNNSNADVFIVTCFPCIKRDCNDKPKVEEPKVEESKVKETKVEEPKVEKTKVEEPKVEEPKVEEPKIEEPKVKKPKVEEPKVEESKIEEPKVEEPKVEEPKVEEPKVEESKVEEPKVEEPKVKEPKVE